MKKFITAFFTTFLAFICFMPMALAVPQPPSLEQPIVDETGTLTAEDMTNISQAIDNTNTDNRSQIAVYMTSHVPDGQSIEEASLEVARSWGIGSTEDQNGVLIYIAKDDNQMRFEVANRAGEYLTDSRSKKIQTNYIIPEFKEGNFAQGILAGVTETRSVLSGNIGKYGDGSSVETTSPSSNFDTGILWGVMIVTIGVLALIALVAGTIKTVKNYREYSDKASKYDDLKVKHDTLTTNNASLTNTVKTLKNRLQIAENDPKRFATMLKNEEKERAEKERREKEARAAELKRQEEERRYWASSAGIAEKKRIKDEKERKRREREEEDRNNSIAYGVAGYGIGSSSSSSSSSFDFGSSSSSSFGGGGGFDGGGSSSSW